MDNISENKKLSCFLWFVNVHWHTFWNLEGQGPLNWVRNPFRQTCILTFSSRIRGLTELPDFTEGMDNYNVIPDFVISGLFTFWMFTELQWNRIQSRRKRKRTPSLFIGLSADRYIDNIEFRRREHSEALWPLCPWLINANFSVASCCNGSTFCLDGRLSQFVSLLTKQYFQARVWLTELLIDDLNGLCCRS